MIDATIRAFRGGTGRKEQAGKGEGDAMRLPKLASPEKYGGLYVFDFGDQVAVGYTADEVAVLLESEEYAEGKVYRIHRAMPDGTMELAGVSREKFQTEDGLFFLRGDLTAARADFDELVERADEAAPPCRMKVHLATLDATRPAHVTAAIFPAEFTNGVADWLTRIGFEGGDTVEGGVSQVTDYYGAGPAVIERRQFWPAGSDARSAEEVLAATHLAVQRRPA